MGRALVFEGKTWEQYEKLRQKDKQLHKKLCQIIREMLRQETPSEGIGQPEALKHELSGYYSRRLNKKDRLIYKFDEQRIYIFLIGTHDYQL